MPGFQAYLYLLSAGNEAVFKDKKVLLLEAAAQKKRHQLPESFGSRVCALSGGTVQLLESMVVCVSYACVSDFKLCNCEIC